MVRRSRSRSSDCLTTVVDLLTLLLAMTPHLMTERIIIQPQKGPQEMFLSCTADIAFYGGAAGGGKTMALLLEPLHYTRLKGFTCVIFRKTYPEIVNAGGLWNESMLLYPGTGAIGTRSGLRWQWPSGATLKFSHLQYDSDVFSWQGSQVAMFGFDELTHFSQQQFLYMLSRNRSGCGVRPYIRATFNPDPDSWVRTWISWWLDDNGDAIPSRSGVIRWFARKGETVEWADSPEPLIAKGMKPKSFTFIAATVHDNQILLKTNPDYLSNLEALLPHERAQLLGGNWNARPVAGSYFRREWCEIVDRAPEQFDDEVRYWDRAATQKNASNPDPDDATVGVHMRRKGGIYYICDVRQAWESPHGVQSLIINTAGTQPACTVCLEEDPGQAGKVDISTLIEALGRYRVEVRKVSTAKDLRLRPFSSQCQAGNVKLVRARWNDPYIAELEGFPDARRDDQADGSSGAYNYLAENKSSRQSRRF